MNFKVRSEDSRRVFQAMERVVTIQSSWTGETVECVCKGVEGGGQGCNKEDNGVAAAGL